MGKNSRSPSVNGSLPSPSAKSINKWKIPHYYKRSQSQHSNQTSKEGDSNVSTPVPNVNLVASPKKVILDPIGNNRGTLSKQKKSSKKNGRMVFVNYTVQDTISENELAIESQDMLSSQQFASNLTVPTDLPVGKNNSRRNMLKIFGSTKNSPISGANSMGNMSNTSTPSNVPLEVEKMDMPNQLLPASYEQLQLPHQNLPIIVNTASYSNDSINDSISSGSPTIIEQTMGPQAVKMEDKPKPLPPVCN
ncbi:hypothetical protein Kpol_1032p50, partial [Vanderwaltozyma polyspora DSM 70294]